MPSRRWVTWISSASALVALAAFPRPGEAQTRRPVVIGEQSVRGRLVDPDLNAPIIEATITLIRGDERITSTLSDDQGYFYLAAPSEGDYRLEAVRLAYSTTLSQPFHVPAGATVTVQFTMRPDAIPLEPIVVTAVDVTGMHQFLRHMGDWGKGVFVTPAMIDSINPQHYADVMRGQEGIWLSWGWGSLDGSGIDNQRGSYGPVPHIRTYLGRGCMTYMIDGMPVSYFMGTSWALNGIGPEIVAAEIYRYDGEVPPDLRNHSDVTRDYSKALATIPGSPTTVARRTDFLFCGLTVFWTKRGW